MRWQHISFQLKPIAWRKSVLICVLGEVHKNWDELNNALWSPGTFDDGRHQKTSYNRILPAANKGSGGLRGWTHIIGLFWNGFPVCQLSPVISPGSTRCLLRLFELHSVPRDDADSFKSQEKSIKFHVGGGRGTRAIVRPLLLLLEVSSSARVTTVNSTARA